MDGEKEAVKRRLPKGVRNTLISAVVLLVLLVAGGVGYVWYMGQQPLATTAKAPAVESKAPQEIKPTLPSADTQESASIQFLTSPVAPGDKASVSVKTVATSSCTITVTYNHVASTDPGLVPKTADDFGNVSWDWTVDANAPVGTWPVKVTCARAEKSVVVQGDLQVAK